MLRETLSALDLTVTIGDQTHKPTMKPGDLVRFEQHFGRSLVDAKGEATIGFTEMLFLAWSALKREGITDKDFEGFCDEVDDLDVGAGKAEAA